MDEGASGRCLADAARDNTILSVFTGGTLYSSRTLQRKTGLKRAQLRFLLRHAIKQGKIQIREYHEVKCGKSRGNLYSSSV